MEVDSYGMIYSNKFFFIVVVTSNSKEIEKASIFIHKYLYIKKININNLYIFPYFRDTSVHL